MEEKKKCGDNIRTWRIERGAHYQPKKLFCFPVMDKGSEWRRDGRLFLADLDMVDRGLPIYPFLFFPLGKKVYFCPSVFSSSFLAPKSQLALREEEGDKRGKGRRRRSEGEKRELADFL